MWYSWRESIHSVFSILQPSPSYYDPAIGRFITRDTWPGGVRDPQSLNHYVYCYNNPMKYTDPWGNFAFVAALALPALSIPVIGIVIAGVAVAAFLAYYAYTEYSEAKDWKDFGLPKDSEVHKGSVDIWDTDRDDPDRNKTVVRINKETGEADQIVLIIDGEKQWTYWKEGDKWYKHGKDSKTPQEVTDQDELDWLEDMSDYAEEEWNEEYGGESGEGSGSPGGGGPGGGSGSSSPPGSPQVI